MGVGTGGRAKYLSLNQARFSETGTDIYNYTLLEKSFESLRPFLNTTLTGHFKVGEKTAIVPSLRVGYEQEVMSVGRNVDVMTAGDDSVWRIEGATPSRGTVTMDAGMTIETSKTQGFYVDYARAQSSTSTNQMFTAGVRYRL